MCVCVRMWVCVCACACIREGSGILPSCKGVLTFLMTGGLRLGKELIFPGFMKLKS